MHTGGDPGCPLWTTAERYVTPYGCRRRRDEGRTGRRPSTESDPQTHRPGPQGRRTTGKRTRNENGAVRLDGRSFAISEDRSQQGCTHQDIGGREQCRRRIRKCSWSGRNEAIRTVIRLRAGYAGMLAIRGDILARAMLGRKNTDRSQEKQGKAGEESGTG